MKIEDLQNYLSQFNPKADFYVIDPEGHKVNFDFGWGGGGDSSTPSDKMKITDLCLFANPNPETSSDNS